MPEAIMQGQSLITKTVVKTRTKVGVVALALFIGTGMMAGIGTLLSSGKVCNTGSRVGLTCRTNLDCRVRSTDITAQCVEVTKLPDLVTKISAATCLYDTDYPTNSALTFQVNVANKGSTAIGTSFATKMYGIRNDGSSLSLPDLSLPPFDLPLSFDSNIDFANESLSAGATATYSGQIQNIRRLNPFNIVAIKAVTDYNNSIAESNETNNASNVVAIPPCQPATPEFSLHPASPGGAHVPGIIEVLRFNVTAPAGGFPVSLVTFPFTLITTDTNGTGTPGGDWNTWRSGSESLGLSPSSFALYDSMDLTTPIRGQFNLSIGGVGLTYDSHTLLIPSSAQINLLPSISIPAGTTKTYILKMNTTGAGRGDSLRIDIPTRVTGNTLTF